MTNFMDILKTIRKQLSKILEPEYQGLLCCKSGSWRVRYPCGGVSVYMPYGNAKTYASIFNGKLEYKYDKTEIKT